MTLCNEQRNIHALITFKDYTDKQMYFEDFNPFFYILTQTTALCMCISIVTHNTWKRYGASGKSCDIPEWTLLMCTSNFTAHAI